VASGVPDALSARLKDRPIKATPISEGWYSFELPPDERPEAFIAELASSGASLVSVTPLRTTLEDVFLERVR
jgi:hypothetical protein